MADINKKNAIESRIDQLSDIWNDFAQKPNARVLRWLLSADEARMIDLFLELQNEELSDIPDLFLRFETPFINPAQYGFLLRDSLCQQYDEIRETFADEGISAAWTCPLPQPDDQATFVAACQSFAAYYADLMELFVAVLLPEQIADEGAWVEWLLTLSLSELPDNVRLMVVDVMDAPALERLAEGAEAVVESIPADLDMPGAMEQIARDVPGHGPGHTFRRLFVALTNAAGSGNLTKSRKIADSALSIATKEKWPQMQVVILMALAGAYIGSQKFEDALDNYRQAEQVAVTANEAGDPAAPKLMLQTKMAQATALIAQSKYVDAAIVYESAASLAEGQQDHFMTMENWRMAAYCQETSEQVDRSWASGQLAIVAAEKLENDLRVNSTLGYVGQGLLRVARKRDDRQGAEQVEQRMRELIGPDWQAKLETGEAPS